MAYMLLFIAGRTGRDPRWYATNEMNVQCAMCIVHTNIRRMQMAETQWHTQRQRLHLQQTIMNWRSTAIAK